MLPRGGGTQNNFFGATYTQNMPHPPHTHKFSLKRLTTKGSYWDMGQGGAQMRWFYPIL